MPTNAVTTVAWTIAAVVLIEIIVAGIVAFAWFGTTFLHETQPVVKPATSGPWVGGLFVFDGFRDIDLARQIAALGGAVWYVAPKQPLTPKPIESVLVVQHSTQPDASDHNAQARQQGLDRAMSVDFLRTAIRYANNAYPPNQRVET